MARRDSQNGRASEQGVQMSWCGQNQNVFAMKRRICWESSVAVTASFTLRVTCSFQKFHLEIREAASEKSTAGRA